MTAQTLVPDGSGRTLARRFGPLATRRVAPPLVGVLALIVAWQIAALVSAGRNVVPAPWEVIRALFADDFYGPSLRTTAWEATRGYVWGNGIALVLAAVCVLVPRLSGVLTRLAVATYCTPTIAVGPLLIVLISPDTTKVVMSALSVFFLTLLGALLGLASAPRASLELVHVAGGSRVFALTRVRIRAAVPATAAALSLSAPAALLGAMIGEYLGGDRGLGVVMVQAQQSLQVPRTWAVALLATALAAAAYLITGGLARVLAFDVTVTDLASGERNRTARRRRPLIAAARAIGWVAAALAAWWGLVQLSGLDPYLAKTPSDVFAWLVTDADSGGHVSLIGHALGTTLRDAGVGYVVGTVVALVLAGLFLISPLIEGMFFPVVLALRSVPLVAMTPLVSLVFGRGLLGVTVLAGAITFVPTLVNVVTALRGVPRPATDLLHAYAVGTLRGLVTVRFVYAVPALAASARIAIPGALLGAVLAELLATGSGLGQLLSVSIINGDFSALWTGVAVLTASSVVLYTILSAVEDAALERMAT